MVAPFSLLFCKNLVLFIIGESMKRLNNGGWGLSTMIGFMIGLVIFLIIIAILSYNLGL